MMADNLAQKSIYFGLFAQQLIAVLAVRSVDSTFSELLVLGLWWGTLYAVSLLCGWLSRTKSTPIYEKFTNIVAIVGLLEFLLKFETIGLVMAFIGLLLWIQAAQNCSLNKRRQFYYAFAISFILILYGSANSKSSLYILFIAVYALAAIYSLYANYFDQRQQQIVNPGPSVSVTQDQVAKLGSVSLLLFFTITTAITLYFTIPRPQALQFGVVAFNGGEDYSNAEWEFELRKQEYLAKKKKSDDTAESHNTNRNDRNANAQESNPDSTRGSNNPGTKGNSSKIQASYQGFQEELDIDDPGQGRLSNEIVMYLQADRALYLKGRVFDHFDGQTWKAANNKRTLKRLKYGALALKSGPKPNQAESVNQVITMEMNYESTIFAAEKVSKLTFPAGIVAQRNNGTFEAPRRLRKGTVYSATSEIHYANGRPYSFVDGPIDTEQYLTLPDNFSERIRQLANEISANDDTTLSKVTAVEQHLRTKYSYTFNTVFDEIDSPSLERFLFETKQGHCEYFATSMVLMLRTLDIPARLVTGFSATNLNPLTGYYEVRGLDAHAWVEAYIPNYGWAIFEPTAFYPGPSGKKDGSVAESLADYAQRLAETAKQVAPDALSTTWLQVWSQLLQAIKEVWSRFIDIISYISNSVWTWTSNGGAILIGSLFLVGYIVYLARHTLLTKYYLLRINACKADYQQCINLVYQAFEFYFKGKGSPRDLAWTVEEYRDSLSDMFPDKIPAINHITTVYSDVRYSNHPTGDKTIEPLITSFKTILSEQK